jgi:hypothetical protein
MNGVGKFTLKGTDGAAGSFLGTGVNKVRHAFSLRQVKLVIQECTQGKLSWLRQPRASGKTTRQQQVHDCRAAMSLQLQNLFSGIRLGSGKVERYSLIDNATIFVTKSGENGAPGLWHTACDPESKWLQASAGNTHHPDTSPAWGRCNRGNHIRMNHPEFDVTPLYEGGKGGEWRRQFP